MTEWRPVLGFEGRYEVSDDGRVRSVTRTTKIRDGRQYTFVGQERKTFLVKGYPHLSIKRNGRHVNKYVHLLVCEAFYGPRPSPQHEARHLNGNPLDNRVENLAWGTKSENAQDTIRHGRNKELAKTHCKYGHAFDAENTISRPRGGRWCRACERRRGRRRAEAPRRSDDREERTS